MNKKAQAAFETMGSLARGIVVLAIVLVVAFLIMAEAQDQIVETQGINESNPLNRTAAYNATITLQEATNDIPGWIGIVVVAGIGAALLALVQMFRNR